MSNRSGESYSGLVSQEQMLKLLMEKNQEIKALKAEISKLRSDAGWAAEHARNQADILMRTSEKW